MRKMSQITTASLKISILALLFIVTAAPHIRDYGGTRLHQKNLESEKGLASGKSGRDRLSAPESGLHSTTRLQRRHKVVQQPAGQVAPLKIEDFGDEVAPTVNNNIGYEPAGQVAPLKKESLTAESNLRKE